MPVFSRSPPPPPPPPPPPASWLPILLVHIGSEVKRRQIQSQSYKFTEFGKISNLWVLHVTHLLKMFDKMCKYEIDPASVVEDTKPTWFCPRDGQTDRWTRWNQYTPFQISWSGVYNVSYNMIICVLFKSKPHVFTFMHLFSNSLNKK